MFTDPFLYICLQEPHFSEICRQRVALKVSCPTWIHNIRPRSWLKLSGINSWHKRRSCWVNG